MSKLLAHFAAADNATGDKLRLARKVVAHANKHPMSICLLDATEQALVELARAMVLA